MKRKMVMKFMAICCVGALGVSSLSGCGKKTEEEKEEVVAQEPEEEEVVEEVNHDGQAKSYLTGQWIDENLASKRPMAVMMGNTPEASPQSSIGSADVYYEVPVEGSMTRIMAIFQDYENLEKIGSVRSCRYYFVHYAMAFDAMYLHYGQSKYAVDLLASKGVDNLNGLEGAVDSTVFFRSSDKSAPHNAFATGSGIVAGIEQKGYETAHDEEYEGNYQFAEDDVTITLDQGDAASYVKPGYLINKPWFEYNAEDGLYYRYQYGDAHADEETGEQLAVKNIIIEESSMSLKDDGKSLNVGTTAGGKGYYITQGKSIPITWSKDSEFAVTHYYDNDGNEITLNQGKTWVCVVDDDYLDKIEIKDMEESESAE